VFSILPIIIIITSLLGLFFGDQAVSGVIYKQLNGTLGKDAAMHLQSIVKNQHINHNNILTTVIGFATLALSASGMVSQIHNAFNNIWNIKEKPKSSVLKYISKHLVSFAILVVLFFVLLVSTTLNSFLNKYADGLRDAYELAFVYEHIISLVVISFITGLMFKYLGDAKMHWKPAILGGLFTGVLFVLGKSVIGLYIGHSHVSSTFGAASVLVLLMLWVYYTSQIIFLGASFVKIISERLHYPIVPNKHAVAIENKEVE
jgi:membrane protein